MASFSNDLELTEKAELADAKPMDYVTTPPSTEATTMELDSQNGSAHVRI